MSDIIDLAVTAPTLLAPGDVDRDQWLALRRQGLGGSDAAAVCGLSPWKGPYHVWLDKTTGHVDEFGPDAEERMWWGHALEDDILERLTLTTGLEWDAQPGMFAHPALPWMLATPDAFCADDSELLAELKTVGYRQAHRWDDGGLPDEYWCQGCHYAAVTGRRTVLFAALIAGQKLEVREVTYTADDIASLVEIEARFWIDHVKAEVPPPATVPDVPLLAALQVEPDDTAECDDPEILAHLLAQYSDAHDAAKRKDQIADEIKALVGEHAGLTISGDLAVSWKTVESDRLDTRALKAAHPDLCAEFTRPSPSRRLHIPKRALA